MNVVIIKCVSTNSWHVSHVTDSIYNCALYISYVDHTDGVYTVKLLHIYHKCKC